MKSLIVDRESVFSDIEKEIRKPENSGIKSLVLSGCTFGDGELVALAELLPELTKLTIFGKNFTAARVADFVMRLPEVQSLTLRYCEFTGEDLGAMLHFCPRLKDLDIDRMAALSSADFPENELECLTLNDSGFTTADIRAIVSKCPMISYLAVLDSLPVLMRRHEGDAGDAPTVDALRALLASTENPRITVVCNYHVPGFRMEWANYGGRCSDDMWVGDQSGTKILNQVIWKRPCLLCPKHPVKVTDRDIGYFDYAAAKVDAKKNAARIAEEHAAVEAGCDGSSAAFTP